VSVWGPIVGSLIGCGAVLLAIDMGINAIRLGSSSDDFGGRE
jgi:hypothetical protein